jgi:uncharacterized protein YjaZ
MTSIEWLEGQILNLMSFDTVDFRKEFREKFEQAKEMHRKEIIDAVNLAKDNAKDVVLGYKTSLDAQMLDSQLPQQEISDEEIEKGAKEWYNKEGAYSASAIALKTWVYAIRWYREQYYQETFKKD